jgi:hypothetical protein
LTEIGCTFAAVATGVGAAGVADERGVDVGPVGEW